MTPITAGKAFRKPISSEEAPKLRMICGDQMPSVYSPAEVPK